MAVPDRQFEIIYSHSVITHLNDALVRGFLNFCGEVLIPGGLLVFSFNGRFAFSRDIENILKHGASFLEVVSRMEKVNSQGYLSFDKSYDSTIGLPSFYQNTFHKLDYLQSLLSPRFEVMAFYPCADLGWQDVIVARKLS